MSKSPRIARAQKVRRGCLNILAFVFLVLGGGVLFGAAALHSILAHISKGLPDVASLYYFEPSQTTKIYSSDNKLIATLFRENRTWTHLDKISPNLVHAVLAIEDSRFYEHRGVDPIGVIRAALAQVRHQDMQGASTITMQLARNLFLSNKQEWSRKIKEMLLAIKIEQTFTKDEIMEMYLNQIYFGAGAYGVEAASKVYFNKKACDLGVAEAAIIAGLPQAPAQFSPLIDEEAARARQKLVLQRMVDMKFLTAQQYDQALAQKLKYYNQKRQEFEVLEVPYFTTYVIKQLYKRFDEDTLYRGGFKVYTTVDLALQKKAEETVQKLVTEDKDILNVHTGALVCVENRTGYLRALCGGLGWTRQNQFNRAWQARRQPGSSFKIFVYTTAIESGMSPDAIVPDAPITIGNWSPQNSDGRFMGSIPMHTALQYSRNVVAVRLLQMVGIKRVTDYAHAMGIQSDIDPNLSIALGAVDVTPLEMCSAISVLPNQGIKVPVSPIKKILDADGDVVEDNTIPPQREVLAESTASIMVDMMKNVVEAGTATNARLEHHEVAGKTGTTDSFRDAWFVGYTRDYTTAAWVGNDDFSKMARSFGGDLPARIWHEFMVYAMRDRKPSTIPRSGTKLVACLMCSQSHKRAGPGCPEVYRQLVLRKDMPKVFCDQHGAPKVIYRENPRDAAPQAPKAAEKPPETVVNPDEPPIPTQVQLPTGDQAPAEVPVNPPAPSGPEPAPVAPEPVDLPPPQPVEVPVAPPPSQPAPPAPAPPSQPAPAAPAPPGN